MAILDMTPCYLLTCKSEPSYVDENGNRHQGRDEWHKYMKCDVVPAGKANEKDFGDGKVQTYTYTIYIYDKNCRDFALGEKVKFCKGCSSSKEFFVKGFHRYQYQCKIWI